MHISQYLTLFDISDVEFAEKLGCVHSLVHAYRNKKKFPTIKMARRIRVLTRGLVSEDTWIDDPPIDPADEKAAAIEAARTKQARAREAAL